MLNVVMLNVVMLNVVAPERRRAYEIRKVYAGGSLTGHCFKYFTLVNYKCSKQCASRYIKRRF